MGQAGSSQQQPGGAGGAAGGGGGQQQLDGSEGQRKTTPRPGLHYTRNLKGGGERHSNNASPSSTSTVPPSSGHKYVARDDRRVGGQSHNATSPTKPRRKSLDMPDMSLSMTGAGGAATPQSAAGTPMYNRVSAAPTPSGSSHTSPKQPLRASSSLDHPPPPQNLQFEDGIPMAASPSVAGGGVGGTSATAASSLAGRDVAGSSITSPTASSAALSPAGRWARHKDGVKEGFGKKAQPVVGEAAVLHASGYSAGQASQNNNAPSLSTSPTVPFQSGGISSRSSPAPPPHTASSSNSNSTPRNTNNNNRLPPVDTSNVRLFQTGDPSLPSAQTDGQSSAQSSGFQTRHDEISQAPPSAPGQPLDPAQLASLLSPAQQLQQQQQQEHQHQRDHQVSSISNSREPSWQNQQDENIAASATAAMRAHLQSSTIPHSQPTTPGLSGQPNVNAPVPSPLKQPTETILAPELPSEVTITVPSAMSNDPVMALIDTGGIPLPPMASNVPTTSNEAIATATSQNKASNLVPGSTPPLGVPPNTLPAAAPFAALNPTLARDPKAQEAVQAATVDLGAGPDGVPTLLTWKAEEETTGTSGLDGTGTLKAKIPSQVFVTGTFAKGWSTKIELRRKQDDTKNGKDFTALVKLPPGPHSLKFIVDKQWKTSKYLPSATDADGNLINYLQVHKVDSIPGQTAADELTESDTEDDDDQWTQDIPNVLLAYGDASEAAMDAAEAAREAEGHHDQRDSSSVPIPALPQLESTTNSSGPQGASSIPNVLPNPAALALNRKPLAQLQSIQPPTLPAQLEKGVLNATVLVAKGSGDDNSLLPKPDHSVLNHLAASPIKGGLLSVGVTTRYRRKYVTTVYYKKPM